MKSRPLSELSDLQKQIMEIIWDVGEITCRDLQERLSKRKRFAYTTVATLLLRLERAGWIKHCAVGRTYIYQPARSRDNEELISSRKLIDRIFSGSPKLLFQRLIEDGDISDEDLSEIRKMIDKKRKERGRK